MSVEQGRQVRAAWERLNSLMVVGGSDFAIEGDVTKGIAITRYGAKQAAGGAPGPPPVPIDIQGPIGVASSGGLLLVTMYLSNDVAYVNCDGNSFVFCTIPGDPNEGEEHYIVIAPSGIYVTRGEKIYLCSLGVATLFTTITGAGFDHVGITYDTTEDARFGGNLIVTSLETGKIWTVDTSGTPTLLADLTSVSIEGPAVAPASFGTYANQLLVADDGEVHAIDSDGTITYSIFEWSGAEGITAMPEGGVGVRCSDDAWYVALENFDLVQPYPSSAFSGMSGILVTSEFGAGIADIEWNGSSYDINFFDNIPDALMEGSCFVL